MATRIVGLPHLSQSKYRRTWFVGDASRDEFVRPLKWLQQHACTILLGDLSAAIELAGERRPDLIVLAASYPGQFREHQILPLRAAVSACEWIYLYGGWCEGETRTGKPLPEVTRIHVSHFSGGVVGQWNQFLSGARPWDIRVESASPQGLDPLDANSRKSVALATASPRAAEQLAEALTAEGYSCRHIGECYPDRPIDIIIWDDGWDLRRPPVSLASVRQRLPRAPMIAP